jgi:hypothetical protein
LPRRPNSVISGSWNRGKAKPTELNVHAHQLLCLNVPESDLGQFWDLESIGISSCESEEGKLDPVWQRFNETVTFVENEGRYEVSLPWKSDSSRPSLLNNEKLARLRLGNLTCKLKRDPDLSEAYDSLTTITKVCPVFDASAKGYNGVSLNDCLETGPCLFPNLVETLIRFRRWPVALAADITKAFLQIKVRKEDQDVHRFFLYHDGETRVMRFVRVPFGNKSSPFLLMQPSNIICLIFLSVVLWRNSKITCIVMTGCLGMILWQKVVTCSRKVMPSCSHLECHLLNVESRGNWYAFQRVYFKVFGNR